MEREYIHKMCKGELHVHLNGLVSTSLVRKKLVSGHYTLPEEFNLETDLNISRPASSLSSYLKPWQALRLIPKGRSCLKIMVKDAFNNLATDNVRFAEIRNSILYISLINKITVREALTWLIEEIEQASKDYEIAAGLIMTTSRGDYASEHFRALIQAYKDLGCPDTVIGLDLAGNEDLSIPDDLASLFLDAKRKYGLRVTVHAGETGNISNIYQAINEFEADRIGHGTAAEFSESLMDTLAARDICIEVCPISNRLTNAVSETDSHPVRKFLEKDVPFVICSDNPSIHNQSLTDDYVDFLRETGAIECLSKMYEMQKKYSFIRGLK